MCKDIQISIESLLPGMTIVTCRFWFARHWPAIQPFFLLADVHVWPPPDVLTSQPVGMVHAFVPGSGSELKQPSWRISVWAWGVGRWVWNCWDLTNAMHDDNHLIFQCLETSCVNERWWLGRKKKKLNFCLVYLNWTRDSLKLGGIEFKGMKP